MDPELKKRFFLRHVSLPALMPAVFFAIALSPVSVLGCRTRGLLALAIAFMSGMISLVAVVRGAKGRLGGDPLASWWVVSSMIMAIPVVAMIIMA